MRFTQLAAVIYRPGALGVGDMRMAEAGAEVLRLLTDIAAEPGGKGVGQVGVCDAPAARCQHLQRPLDAETGTIGPGRGEGVERVGNAADPGGQWNLHAAQPLGIAGAIVVLVMMQDRCKHGLETGNRLEHLVAQAWMELDLLELHSVEQMNLSDIELANLIVDLEDEIAEVKSLL